MNRNKISKTTRMKVMADAYECVKEYYRDTTAALQAAGFRKLGGGHYGSAWTRKDIEGWAIKVSGADDGDSFPAYVYWCMANPMPHIPEYQFPVFSTDRQQFMVMMPQYQGCAYDIECMKGEVWDTYKYMSEALSGFAYPVQGPHYEIMFAAQQIRSFFSGKVSFDMHSENIMIDPQTQRMIITDPIHQGDTDSMITQITGVQVSRYPKHQMQVQMSLPLLESQSAPAAPARLQDSVEELRALFRDLVGGGRSDDRFDAAIGRPFNPQIHNIPKMRVPKVDMQMLNFDMHKGLMDWKVIQAPIWDKPIQQVMVGDRPINQQELYKLGRHLNGMVLDRRRGPDLCVALFPSMPAFLKFGENLGDKAAVVDHVRLSWDQAEYIQAQWRIDKQNKDMQGWVKPAQFPPMLDRR